MNHSRSKRVQHQTFEQKTLDYSTETVWEQQQKQSVKTSKHNSNRRELKQ